jgi:phosphoglycolate phosphatase
MSFSDWLLASKASAGDFVLSLGVQASKDDVNRRYEQVYNELVTRSVSPIRPTVYPAAAQALDLLKQKNLRLAVVSSHPQANLFRELAEYQLADFFDVILGDPLPKTKRICDICLGLGIPPKEAFFVEDTVYGLRSGHGAGVHCFGVTTGYHSRSRLEAERTAVAVIDSLTELPTFIS